ncbi:MAG: hypothetical protein AB7H66_14070 [Hyphomonadaceae bacterium]
MRAIAIAVLTALAACGQTIMPTPTADSSPDTRESIIARMPLIDACLMLSPETRVVTIDPASNVFVRLSGNDQNVDCVIPDDTTDPSNAAIVAAREDVAMSDPILFVRAPGENPGGECYEAPEVRGDAGELLGWTLDPEGC